ncbi:LOW QUALITY PROTEIN: coiled-coil domain-containing protein 172-like [Clarias gariepinus]
MSQDTLYQHILLTQQQAFENTRRLHEAKSDITKAEAKIKSFTENLEQARTKLEEKARLESEMKLQLSLIKRQQEELKKKTEDFLKQQSGLRREMKRINKEAAEEREKFMKAFRTFISDYNLLTKNNVVFESQTRAKILKC